MKKFIILTATIILAVGAMAQAPQKMSYQAVVRDAGNHLFTNQKLCIQISILQYKTEGDPVFVEIQVPSSNENGLVTLEIGMGTVVKGDFSKIDWSTGPYFIKTEIDLNGGTNYTITGTSELVSVPYALHAKTAESLTGGIAESDPVFGASAAGKITGADTTRWNNKLTAEIDGSVTNELQTLRISHDTIYLTQGGFVRLPTAESAVLHAPVATIQPASNLQSFSATVNCWVNGNGFSTTSVFDWGLTITYGNLAIVSPNIVTGSWNSPVSSNLTGLQSSTTYHYRLRATNAVNEAFSSDMTFTTLPSAPQLTTAAINSPGLTSASSGGVITYDGGSPVTARGVCYAANPGPSLANGFTSNGTGPGAFISAITGLAMGSTYYVRAYATNSVGTTYGNEIIFMAGIGATYLGGKIGYILQPGDPGYIAGQPQGLIAAEADQVTGPWGCTGVAISGAEGTALGTGSQNTLDIMAGCSAAGIAARICGDLVQGGYSDWYLPSKDELNKLFLNRALIGGFANSEYWSSSESDYSNGWYHQFGGSFQSPGGKDNSLHVRAVRSF